MWLLVKNNVCLRCVFFIHVPSRSFLISVWFICLLFVFYFTTHVCIGHFMVHCGSAFEPGASGLPYYCTPPVCGPDVIGALAVWRQITKNNSHTNALLHTNTPLQNNIHASKVHCGSAYRFVPGASRSPYYCAPLACVLNFSRGLVVWWLYKQTNKQKSPIMHQEITRVILCRLILNDIIIHIKFLNDIIMFSKIVWHFYVTNFENYVV